LRDNLYSTLINSLSLSPRCFFHQYLFALTKAKNSSSIHSLRAIYLIVLITVVPDSKKLLFHTRFQNFTSAKLAVTLTLLKRVNKLI
jgi:hypothetical protein